MKELIDKTAVVAEIKSLMRTVFTNFDEGVNAAATTLLESIDTLEVKEVDSTDAFIERACEYMRNHIDRQLTIYHEQTWKKRDEFIEDFKNYMEVCK